MSLEHWYDVLIVGAGPAGLSAARTAARLGFKTLVVERLAGPGELAHASHAIIVPAPELVSGRRLLGGLFFPQVDLWIPETLIEASDTPRRCFSPGGLEFQTVFIDANNSPSLVIDKGGVLELMANQAASCGAQFRFGTEVTGLLVENDTVVGVQTLDGEIRADLVIAADGSMGRLCEQAGLHAPDSESSYLLALEMELDAPAVKPADLGQIVTLGKHPAFPDTGFASLVMPAPGRAHVTFMRLVDELSCAAGEPAAACLEEYKRDSRVAPVLAGAEVVRQSSYYVPLKQAPASIVANGFIAVGDAIAPNGRLGILPAIYLGRQAALFAAEALDAGATSAADLAAFDEMFRSALLPALQAEATTTTALLQMSEGELDRLCSVLNALHLPVPFLDYKPKVEWDTAQWLLQQLPVDAADVALLHRALGSETRIHLEPSMAEVRVPEADLLPR